MMFKKNKWLISSLLVISLAGCTTGQPVTPSKESKNENNTPSQKIIVWTDEGESNALESSIELFEGQYGVKVEVDEVPISSQFSRLREAAGTKSMPDIITMPHDQIGEALVEKFIQPVSFPDEVKNRYLSSAMDGMTYEGKLYGLPKSVETPVFVYNKDLIPKAPETWEDVQTYAQTLKQQNITGFAVKSQSYDDLSPVLNSFGSFAFTRENGSYLPKKLGINNEGSLKGLTFLKDLHDQMLLPTDSMNVVKSFEDGTLASSVVDMETYEELKNLSSIKLGISTVPKSEKDLIQHSFFSEEGWFLTYESKHKDIALQFLNHISLDEHTSFYFETSGEIVPTHSLLTDETQKKNEFVSTVLHQAESGLPYPNIPEMRELDPSMDNAIRITLQGFVTPKEALKYANQDTLHLIDSNHSNQ